MTAVLWQWSTFRSLGNRDFRYLWAGSVLMWAGGSIQTTAQGFMAYELTGSARALGVVSLAAAIPMLSLSLFAGAITDRVERKRLIQLFQGVEGLIAIGIAGAIWTGTITWIHLVAAAAAHGTLFAFMLPARQAIIPQLVPRQQVTNAMALNTAGMSVTTLTAPAVAGWVYTLTGPLYVYLMLASVFLISLTVTSVITVSWRTPPRDYSSTFGEIAKGLGYLRKVPLAMSLLLITFTTITLTMPLPTLLPVLVVEVYSDGAYALGILMGASGLGSLIGSLMVASLSQSNRGLLLFGGILVSGLALATIAVFPIYLLGVGAMITFGLGGSSLMTVGQPLLVEKVKDEYRGRVMSLYMMIFGLSPIAVLPVAASADLWGVQFAMGALAALLLMITIVYSFTMRQVRVAV